MHWWFELIEKTENTYVYAYSRQSRLLDGIIVYYIDTEEWEMTRESVTDEGKDSFLDWSLEKFCWVVDEGFPASRHVCCG